MEIKLPNGVKIGDGQKPFIIAEVGSNITSFEDAKNSIVQAKLCGASAVKFQLYDDKALFGFDVPGFNRANLLDPTWLPLLKEKADVTGIELMCSAFSVEGLTEVDKWVNIHKCASAELTHVRMLEKLKKIGKPVILSTGASGDGDIKNALTVLGDTPVVLMYCVAAYPANDVNPWLISVMRGQYQRLIGYSDHSLDVQVVPVVAANQGACVIEKHFTAFPELDTPDRLHSLTVEQFKTMCAAVKGHPVSTLGVTKEEKQMVSRHNRRLIATQDLLAGHVLREGENFGIYRSLVDESHAYSPWAINDINGKTLKQAVKAGAGIGPGDVII